MPNGKGALHGLRVLDFTQVILGPSCTAVLADHGADVIKVERPGSGDLSRAFGPFKNDASLSYGALNRNKRSIAINLKNDAGRDLVHRMVATSDIVVNNFRPGVMEGLGLGYEDLKKHNAGIIYATGTGFGTSGPLAESRKAGHDTMAQALTGAMTTNAGADGAPRRIPLPVADMTAGNLLVQGILMALLARQKTGEGQVVEVALLDALLWLQAWHVAGAANPLPSGATREGSNPLDGGIYHTTDGFIVVTGLFKPNPLADICNVLGIPDLSQDERFSSVPAMVANAAVLRELLQAPLRTRTTAEWVRDLEAADILAAPILTIDEAIDLPQVAHNEMIVGTPDGNRHVGVPVKLTGTPGNVETAPPEIGEHTSEILQELGLNKDEINQLIEAGAVVQGNGSNP